MHRHRRSALNPEHDGGACASTSTLAVHRFAPAIVGVGGGTTDQQPAEWPSEGSVEVFYEERFEDRFF